MDNQRIIALVVIILAGFGLWLQSQDRLVPFLEAIFGGGGGGKLLTSTQAPTAPTTNDGPLPILPYPPVHIVPIAPGHPNGWGFGGGHVGPLPPFPGSPQ